MKQILTISAVLTLATSVCAMDVPQVAAPEQPEKRAKVDTSLILAIQGQGLFVVADDKNGSMSHRLYVQAAKFNLIPSPNPIIQNGFFGSLELVTEYEGSLLLCGWPTNMMGEPIDSHTGIPLRPNQLNDLGSLQLVKVPPLSSQIKSTSKINLTVNLPETHKFGSMYTKTIEISDCFGQKKEIILSWRKISVDTLPKKDNCSIYDVDIYSLEGQIYRQDDTTAQHRTPDRLGLEANANHAETRGSQPDQHIHSRTRGCAIHHENAKYIQKC